MCVFNFTQKRNKYIKTKRNMERTIKDRTG